MIEAVIFIGIPASGKSSFYEQRFANTHVRINLDTLKTRRREDALLKNCIEARQPFVVDNTNVLISERAKYIQLAKPAGYTITGFYFQSSLGDALLRNQQRAGKASVPVKGVAAKYRLLQPPSYAEGFDLLYVVSIDAHSGFLVSPWTANGDRTK